jgi:hypothetical protein
MARSLGECTGMLPRLPAFFFWKVSKAGVTTLGEHLGRTRQTCSVRPTAARSYKDAKDASVPDSLPNNRKLWEITR